MVLRKGTILNGEYAGWEIQIVDDTRGDTGGFYLILCSEERQTFDYWFEKKEHLNDELDDYNVKWTP